MIQLHPLLPPKVEELLHPQLVAVKSLIIVPPKFYLYNIICERFESVISIEINLQI